MASNLGGTCHVNACIRWLTAAGKIIPEHQIHHNVPIHLLLQTFPTLQPNPSGCKPMIQIEIDQSNQCIVCAFLQCFHDLILANS